MQLSFIGARPPLRRERAIAVASLLVLSASVAVVADVARAAPPPSREMTFIDRRSGMAFVLQVEPNARDAGAFVFRVPGVGLFEGRVGSRMRALSPASIVVDYEGPATLVPRISPDTTAGGGDARTVQIRLQAQVNPKQRTAEATLSDGASRHHLVVRTVGAGGLARSLKVFEDGVIRGDWDVLYDLMNLDIRAAFTRSSFAAQLDAEVSSVGRIIELRRVSVGEVETDDNGAMFVMARYSAVTRAPNGDLQTTPHEVYFIPEQDEWKIWFTAER